MDQYLLTTKLSPSATSQDFVARPRLTQSLASSAGQRLRVIHASAGYGKTSLLSQWHNMLTEDGVATAWLSVDQDDNRPSTFVSYLLKAFEQAGVELPSSQALVGNSLRNTALKSLAIVLINEVARGERPVHLLLDDYENISNPDIHEMMDFLLTRACDELKFTIAGRTAPPLALADLVVRNEVTTLTAADLKMDLKETVELFSSDAAHLSIDDITMLVERTEGWVIALRLANLWISSQQDSTAQIASFSGRVAELADYMTEQIFASRPEQDQRFLLVTALPRRINGDLANALCDRTDGWSVLERLQKQDLLIEAVDRERRWYRYHNLFREFLVGNLKRTCPNEVEALHGKAADWHLTHGDLTEAVRHAHAAGDTSAVAAELEARGGWLLYLKGHLDLMELAADLVAPADIDAHLRLSLFRAHALLKQQEMAAAREVFEGLRAQTEDFTVWNGQPIVPLQQAEIALMDCLISGYEDRPFTASDLARIEQLCESLPLDESLLRATAFNVACLIYLQAGQLDRCQSAGNRAIAYFRRVNAVYMESFIYFHQGKSLLMQGKLRDTEMVYAENDHLVKQYFSPDSDFALIESVYRAELLYLQNKLDQARECISEPLARMGNFDAWFDIHHTTFGVAAGISRATEGFEAAEEVLQRGRRFAVSADVPRLTAMIEVQQIQNLLWTGDGDAALAAADRFGIARSCEQFDPENLSTRRIYVAHRLLLARLALFAERPVDALGELDGLAAELESLGADYGELEPMLLRAMCLFQSDRTDEAFAFVDRAVSLALFDDHQRPFIEDGELILPLLEQFSAQSQSAGSNRLRDRFLRDILQALQGEVRARDRARSVLTSRQVEVLQHVQRGFSNKEIARRIDVGENTIKFHLKNIYRTLDTTTRQGAIAEATRRNLL
ncbi:MAG: LuxR C-terminal-related transcriptional regulator [Pseudomonadota bacterium]